MTGPRACAPSELPQLARLADAVFRSKGGSMQAEYPLVFGEENLNFCRVIEEDGRIVSHVGVSIRDASLLGCSLRVASIGAVCTDAAYRGRGYASLLMEDARTLALGEGASLMLISGGRGLYHRLGYVNVGSFRSFTARAEILPVPAEGLRVEPCGAAQIPGLIALHQRLPVRFVRPADDWEKLLAAGMIMNQRGDCLGVWEEGRLVAYAAVQRPRDGAPARVREYAGSETALFAALGAVARYYEAFGVEVVAMPGTEDLARLLRNAGAEEKELAFTGTLGILDVDGFFACIHPYVRECLGAPTDALFLDLRQTNSISFEYAGERYALANRGQLTALVFGGSTEEARSIPEAPPGVGEILKRIFPMPLLWYGYNYV